VKELDELLAAYDSVRRNGGRCLLATLVKVEGSSYRRVGARMLLTDRGERTGGMSGGCMEGEIQKKAWWLTEQGAVVERYQTSGEEGIPYGLGCNGILHVLLKRVTPEDAERLDRLRELRSSRAHAAMATVLSGNETGAQRLFPGDAGGGALAGGRVDEALQRVAGSETTEYLTLGDAEVLVEALPPRQRIVVFGAGDDVKPLVHIARVMGWDVTVADGRSHLATAVRFTDATDVVTGPVDELPARCGLRADDAVVLMTHSFEQDQRLLNELLTTPLRYIGQLGPRQRTQQLLADVATDAERVARAARLHSPIGLDIGGHTAETIALAIVAQIQSVLSRRDAGQLVKQGKSGATEVLA
jgi:xanthine dehydrogenase accessory factor